MNKLNVPYNIIDDTVDEFMTRSYAQIQRKTDFMELDGLDLDLDLR